MPRKKYLEQGHNQWLFLNDQDQDEDLSVKDQDKDKDLRSKDQDQDFKYVLKDSLRTRTWTRTTTLAIANCSVSYQIPRQNPMANKSIQDEMKKFNTECTTTMDIFCKVAGDHFSAAFVHENISKQCQVADRAASASTENNPARTS